MQFPRNLYLHVVQCISIMALLPVPSPHLFAFSLFFTLHWCTTSAQISFFLLSIDRPWKWKCFDTLRYNPRISFFRGERSFAVQLYQYRWLWSGKIHRNLISVALCLDMSFLGENVLLGRILKVRKGNRAIRKVRKDECASCNPEDWPIT